MPRNSNIQIQISAYAPVFSKKLLRKNLRTAGQEVAAAARRNIRSTIGGGRIYYGAGGSIKYRGGANPGKYRASAPGQSPVNVTGTLARSIKARLLKGKNRDVEAITDSAFYAKFLEVGAKGGKPGGRNKRSRSQLYVSSQRVLAPRQFLSRALAERASSIERRMADAAVKDIVMERVRT
ncbi:HK97 gp10 family phage protein [Komagataeibacter xylinus]|uniref:Uncharacterized protein n=1 Tax=Komagataeibacter xylinus TaxID=28448 RepID=A0A857FTI6_KOMXY|nr:HK97 gp10 family phage protein [Komagataeibacter xylinus]QHC36457.1 hypothetical protein FMA36_13965 [Komagataeibacter xylinus]